MAYLSKELFNIDLKAQLMNIFTYHNHSTYRYSINKLIKILKEETGIEYTPNKLASILKKLTIDGKIKSLKIKKTRIYYHAGYKKPLQKFRQSKRPHTGSLFKRIF